MTSLATPSAEMYVSWWVLSSGGVHALGPCSLEPRSWPSASSRPWPRLPSAPGSTARAWRLLVEG
eukprot:322531-Pyramimonas_sp.AAC.1